MTIDEAIQVLNMVEAHGSLVIQAKEMAIKALEQEPKTGHWINLKDTYGDIVESVCSNCDHNGNYKWEFCPNCGAKMESEDKKCR